MTGYQVEARGLTVSFGAARALQDVSFTWPAGAIAGVLGRNGAGKSTLLQVLAAFRRPDAGEVLLDGEPAFGNPARTPGICLIREAGDFQGATRISDVLARAAAVRESFDADGAVRLLADFGLDPHSRLRGLSRGQRSALACTVGIAARAPLTLLDECYLGMDTPSRRRFYDALVAGYLACPRTIVVSSHLLAELEPLLERALILGRGQVIAEGPADDLRETGVTLTGPAAAIGPFIEGRDVLAARELGTVRQVTLRAHLGEQEAADAARLGITIGNLPLEDLYVALTEGRDTPSAPPGPGSHTGVDAVGGTGSDAGTGTKPGNTLVGENHV